jgi:hypothetical protein
MVHERPYFCDLDPENQLPERAGAMPRAEAGAIMSEKLE